MNAGHMTNARCAKSNLLTSVEWTEQMMTSNASRAALFWLLICSPLVAKEVPVPHWVGTWAASPMGYTVSPDQPAPSNLTYRDIVRIGIGGPSLRVQLTNEFGTQPLLIGAARIALSGEGESIQPNTDHTLTFNGRSFVTIPAGGLVFSDPVPMAVVALSSIAVSIYLPEQPVAETTCHADAQSTNFVTKGDTVSEAVLRGAREIYSWCFVKGIAVLTGDNTRSSIVTFGDSITDGWQSTRDANRRWPDVLEERLQAAGNSADITVLNEGISGNCLLQDTVGPNALARFDRDVLAQSGVKYLIVLEGINDIGGIVKPQSPENRVSAQAIIFALAQLVTRAHQHGILVYGATLMPYRGAKYFSDEGETIRDVVNEWIRTSGVFNAVIDFDKIMRDPSNRTILRPAFDSGDHLHPNDYGYRAMGSAIALSLFNNPAEQSRNPVPE
jgi:lysophospholipase L1-like esterase